VSDPLGIIARPYSTIDRKGTFNYFAEIQKLIVELDIAEIVVGLPKSMKGTDSEQTRVVRDFILQLQEKTSIPIQTTDERLSSVSAKKIMVQKGIKTGVNKSEIDRTAACIILQEFLDTV